MLLTKTNLWLFICKRHIEVKGNKSKIGTDRFTITADYKNMKLYIMIGGDNYDNYLSASELKRIGINRVLPYRNGETNYEYHFNTKIKINTKFLKCLERIKRHSLIACRKNSFWRRGLFIEGTGIIVFDLSPSINVSSL